MSLFSGLFNTTRSLAVGKALGTDIHAHWLPGIDDGAPDVSTSLALVEGLYTLGFRRLVATPHIYPEFYPNTPDTIRTAWEKVAPVIRERWPDLQTSFAAEYFLDDSFRALAESQELLTFLDNRILLEFSFLAEPPGAEEVFFQLRLKGYRPVLAHVERYPFLFNQDKKLDRYRDMGVEFQGNLLAFTGHYGPDVRQQAIRLLFRDAYTYLGTDLHHADHLQQLSEFRLPPNLAAKMEEGTFRHS